MIAVADNPFALDDFESVLRFEAEYVAVRAATLPQGRALVVQASRREHGDAAIAIEHAVTTLHVRDGRLDGDVRCGIDMLPFEADAFRLVFVQHVENVIDDIAPLAAECARVLAAGGLLAWSGLSACHPWCLRQRMRHRGMPLRLRAPQRAARELCRDGLVVERIERIGGLWPRKGAAAWRMPLPQANPAWLLCLAKRHVAATPLRLPVRRAAVAMQAPLAAPSRRSVA